MLDNDLLRAAIVTLILIVTLLFGNLKSKVNKLIYAILVVTFLGEMVTVFKEGYNLLYYSILNLMHMTILGYIVVVETKKRTLALMSVGAVYLVYLFYLLTDYSSLTFFNWNYPIQGSYPINVHQYYDISTIINLGSLIIVFYWLYKLVYSNAIYSVQIKPKYLYIFAFLILYAGTFFILAFGRSLLIDPQNWQYLWGTIFLPIYVLFNILLFRGLLWK